MKPHNLSPDVINVNLPSVVPLDWCTGGFPELPWFPDEQPAPRVRLVATRPLEYVDPVACAMIAAWANVQATNGQTVLIDDAIKSPYTWRIGLLSALAGRPHDIATATDRILRVTNLPDEAAVNAFIEKVRALLHFDEETTRTIVYCLSELLRNVFEHSESPVGAFVAASHFPKTNRVSVGIADLGVTVPVHVRRRYAPEDADGMTASVALRVALEPHVSGSYDSNRNAGLGLYMTHRIADLTGGKFWMLTGGLCARNDGDADELGGRGSVKVHEVANRWKGTVVALTLYPSRLTYFNRVLKLAQDELSGSTTGRSLDLFKRKQPLEGSTVISVRPDVSNVAQNKLEAARIRQSLIMPALHEGRSISLDFSGVALTTQSYMHALLAEPFRALGKDNLKDRVRFIACNTQLKEVILIVMGYVLDEE